MKKTSTYSLTSRYLMCGAPNNYLDTEPWSEAPMHMFLQVLVAKWVRMVLLLQLPLELLLPALPVNLQKSPRFQSTGLMVMRFLQTTSLLPLQRHLRPLLPPQLRVMATKSVIIFVTPRAVFNPKIQPPADPLPAFRDFVVHERQRLTQKRQALVKSEMDKRMAELVKFSQNFKVCCINYFGMIK